MYNNFYFLFDDFIFFLYFGKLNHPKHFVLYSVCSKLYSIYLLTEYLSNGCLVSYLRSHGKGPFLPFTFLEVCWMSVLWSGTLIPEPRAHEGRQHSVHCCRPVSSTLKQSTLECRISWVVRDPQGSWWAVLVTCDLSAAPPELLCAEPAGCLCSADHNAFWGECQQRQCSCGWSRRAELTSVRSCPCLPSTTSPVGYLTKSPYLNWQLSRNSTKNILTYFQKAKLCWW